MKSLFKTTFTGYLVCIFLTLAAYLAVVGNLLSQTVLVATIVLLGLTQAFVQLLVFLHLGREPKPHWNLMVFLFMLLVIIILVFGSLWIMHNLNYHMMPMDMKEGI